MKVIITVVAFSLVVAMAVPAMAQDGAALYKTKCQMCHGPDGKGSAVGLKMGAKPFSETKGSEKEFIEITENGKGKMPAFKGKLTDAQIKDVVTYVRTLK